MLSGEFRLALEILSDFGNNKHTGGDCEKKENVAERERFGDEDLLKERDIDHK